MRVFLAFVLATVMLVQAPQVAHAVNPDEVLSDPALEARARELSKELRCLVCQNQSIDDSDAQLAKDLRVLVRERLVAGDSDREAINFIVDRYGEYVLLKPRFAIHTLILWISPFILFGIGAVILWVQRSRKQEAVSTLSAEEEEALEKLLEGESQSSS